MWRDAMKTCAGALLCLGVASGALAQQTSSTMQTKKFEIVAVDGNMVVVKGPDGTKELTGPGRLPLHRGWQTAVGPRAQARHEGRGDDHHDDDGHAGLRD